MLRNNLLLLFLGLFILSYLPAQFSHPPNTPEEFEEQYQWRIRQEKLDGIYIPKGLDDAFRELDRLTDEESQTKFAQLPEEQAFRKLYHSLRLWLIQNWGLAGGSRLSHLFRPLHLRHPDDIAEVIVTGWHRHLNGKTINLKELVKPVLERRKEIWQEQQEPKY